MDLNSDFDILIQRANNYLKLLETRIFSPPDIVCTDNIGNFFIKCNNKYYVSIDANIFDVLNCK